MASYHQKIINSKPDPTKSRHSKVLVAFDDQIDEGEQPNVFADQKIDSPQKVPQVKKVINKQRDTPVKILRTDSQTMLKTKKQNSSRLQSKLSKEPKVELRNNIKEPERRLQIIDDQYVDQHDNQQQQVHGVSRKSWLSLRQSFNLLFGQFFYTYKFPIRRQIPIIANNLDLEREKYQNGTYISQSFDNNLQVSFILSFLKTNILENFLRLSVIVWILAIILGFVSKSEQYRPGAQIFVGIFGFYCVFATVLQYFALRNRRNWTEPSENQKYKVYHYDNQLRIAQWVLTDVTNLRPGNIYKVPIPTSSRPSVIPADSILLHGPCTIVQADQSSIIEYLSPMEKQESISLKQTLLKSDVVLLPITGVIQYQLAAPQIFEENVYGKFLLQEPTRQTYNINYNNVMLRGTRLLSPQIVIPDYDGKKQKGQSSILAVVLQTGIDSLVLKTSQYPYQYRNKYTMNYFIDMLLLFCSIIYLILVGSGILIGYIYIASSSVNRGYYIQTYLSLGQTPVTISEITLHHFGNLIMVVPIILRIIYLIYINIIGRRVGNNLNIQVKDMHILAQVGEPEVLVTTIASDLVRMGDVKSEKIQVEVEPLESQNLFSNLQEARSMIKNRSLQSIRVGGIHHNFLTTRIDNDMYSTKDIDMICYFMSLALLTCKRKNPTPLQRGVIQRCNKQFKLKVEKLGKIIKIGQLRVSEIMNIPSTEKYPFKITFFKHGKDLVQDVQNAKVDPKQKILCLIRGDPTKVATKINDPDTRILNEFSSKLHQEKGLHIQFLGKFVISYEQFLEVKRAYLSSQRQKNQESNIQQSRASSMSRGMKYGIEKFYQNLERYTSKVDGMGLLIWQNPYNILGENYLPISSISEIQYKIIIAPPSRSQTDPQFQSIHAITNYLLKSSNLSLKQISNKILHQYSNKETFWTILTTEKLVVLNGWDYRMIKKMLTQLKEVKRQNKKQVKMLGYIEQDQYAWVLKQTDISITTKGDGHDLEKYSDILINKNSSQTTKNVIRFTLLSSRAYACCINGLIIIQLMKSVLLLTIQFIYFFYTWGTGLVLIGTPLYLILQIGLLLDFLYYLFPKISEDSTKDEVGNKNDQVKSYSGNGGKKIQNYITLEYMIIELFSAIVIGIFLTFIPIYSLTEPATIYGTTQPKQFTHVMIHFILYHVLVLRKIFVRPYALSVYKLIILAIQIGVYYIGLVIVSAVDYYQYKGVIWYALQGKAILGGIFMVWMILGVYWLAFMIQTIMHSKIKPVKNTYMKVNQQNQKKEQEVSSNQKDTIQVQQPIDID